MVDPGEQTLDHPAPGGHGEPDLPSILSTISTRIELAVAMREPW